VKLKQLHDANLKIFLQENPELDPKTATDMFDQNWDLMPRKLSSIASTNLVQLRMKQVSDDVAHAYGAPSKAFQEQLKNKAQALALVPTTPFTGIDGKTVDPSALTENQKIQVTDWLGTLMAGEGRITTDQGALIRAVTQSVVEGVTDFNTVEARVGRLKTASNEPLLGDMQSVVNNRLLKDNTYNSSPTSVPDVERSITDMIHTARVSAGVEASAFADPARRGKDQSLPIQADQDIQNGIDQIESVLAAMKNPLTGALYEQVVGVPKGKTVAWLKNAEDELKALRTQVETMRSQFPNAYGKSTATTPLGTNANLDSSLGSVSPILTSAIVLPQPGDKDYSLTFGAAPWLARQIHTLQQSSSPDAKLIPQILNKAYANVAALAVPPPVSNDVFSQSIGTPRPAVVPPDAATVDKIVKKLFDDNTQSRDPNAAGYMPDSARLLYEKNIAAVLLAQNYAPPSP
jgi:hypothetical protein